MQGRRTWTPGVQTMEGLPPGLPSQEPPQVGRILQLGQLWIAFDSKSVQATAHVRRTCQIVQLWVDGTIRYRKWTPMDPVTPFPLQQGTHMQADVSRDGNSDLFSTSVDGLFGSADRIRFVSLSPPKLASIGGNRGLFLWRSSGRPVKLFLSTLPPLPCVWCPRYTSDGTSGQRGSCV